MKIIKEGKKPDPIKRFKCSICGCEFEAEKGEYRYTDLGYNQAVYKSDCPCCGAIVWRDPKCHDD